MKRLFHLEEGWLSFLLLNLMLLTSCWSIQAASWAEGLSLTTWAVIAGLAVGLALAKAPFPDSWRHLLDLALGVLAVALLGGSLVSGEEGSLGRLAELWARLRRWAVEVMAGRSGTDNLVFVLGLCLLFWLLGYFSAWFVFRRHNPWWPVIMVGAVTLLNLYYSPPNLEGYWIAFLACALLLLVRCNAYREEERWRAKGIRYSPDIALDFVRDGAVLVVLVFLVAWKIPQRTIVLAGGRLDELWNRVGKPWEGIQMQWNRAFAGLGGVGDEARSVLFGHLLSLRETGQVGDSLVMEVKAPEGRYWRGMVYDQYRGDGWIDTDSLMVYLRKEDSNLAEEASSYALRRLMTQTVRLLQPGARVLYAASLPILYDVPAVARLNREPGKVGGLSPPVEPSAVVSQSPWAKEYRAVSSVSEADEASLRGAGEEYPAWVKARYLALPPTLPERVRNLARQLSEGEKSAYDKAKAIEAYLRPIPYNLNVQPSPEGKDAVDYFLFEQREGYCNHYASAMVVMLRAVGIPARIVVGYARGEYEPVRSVYLVRQKEAHAWVEAFFPTYGWVEFEPTGSRPPIQRPRTPEEREEKERQRRGELEEAGPMGEGKPPEIPDSARGPTGLRLASGWRKALWLLPLVLAVAGGAWGGWGIWRATRLTGKTLAERAYERLGQYARFLRVRQEEHWTPFELAERLSRRIPKGGAVIFRIVRSYVEERFGRVKLSPGQEKEVERQVILLRRVTLEEWLMRWWGWLVRLYRLIVD